MRTAAGKGLGLAAPRGYNGRMTEDEDRNARHNAKMKKVQAARGKDRKSVV